MKPIACLSFLAAAALAQAPLSPSPRLPEAAVPVVSTPLTEPLYDLPGDGRLWVSAPGYKASFGVDGFTFVPFLGSDAERNWPVQFRLAEATAGASKLALGAAAPAREGDVVSLDRGPVQEVYRISGHAVEQMFCFPELPERGRISVRLAVATDLAASPESGGFLFRGPRGGVRYGRATAVDGNGRTLPLVSEWTGSDIVITVPEEFVAAAALPLWIDPVVGSIVYGTTFPAAVTSVDVASFAVWRQHAGAFSYAFSAADSDAYLQRYTEAMAPEGSLITLDATQDSWHRCKLAGHDGAQEYLVVAEVKGAGVQDWWVSGRTVGADPLMGVTSQMEIARAPVAGQYFATAPDVGGSIGGGSHWVVVWQQGAPGAQQNILMRTLSVQHVLGAVTSLASTAFDETAPRISETNGEGAATTRNWMVVWRLVNGASSLMGCSLTATGAVRTTFTALTSIGSSAAYDVSSPTEQVAGLRNHLVVFDGQSAATGSSDVFGVLLNHWGGVVRATTNLTMLETNLGSQMTRNQSTPAVDCDGIRFTVAYRHQYSVTDDDVRAMTVAAVGSPVNLAVQDSTNVAASTDQEIAPSVIWSGNEPSRMLIGWQKATAGGSFRAEYRLYDGMAAAGGFATRATGCGGLPIVPGGLPALGGEFYIDVQGTGLQGFVAGLPVSVPLAACPGCMQGVDGSTVLAGILFVTVPPSTTFVGLTLAFQGFDFAGAACLGAVRLSDTVDVTIR